ncbi:Hpt domain-containing protein [Vibrio sp. BS-M-Sm-2]|uniref:Hpt domain-containing protein n=1 Tax=Vibrio sp. BS-M-Sm-2 TaxID=3241167 RepID=UPI003557F9F6
MYKIDNEIFLRATGVDCNSKMGKAFRVTAVTSLRKIIEEVGHNKLTNKELAHKIKGIASAMGFNEAAYICGQVEIYDELLSYINTRKALAEIVRNMLQSCEVREGEICL